MKSQVYKKETTFAKLLNTLKKLAINLQFNIKQTKRNLKKTFYKQDTYIENKTMIKCSPL